MNNFLSISGVLQGNITNTAKKLSGDLSSRVAVNFAITPQNNEETR